MIGELERILLTRKLKRVIHRYDKHNALPNAEINTNEHCVFSIQHSSLTLNFEITKFNYADYHFAVSVDKLTLEESVKGAYHVSTTFRSFSMYGAIELGMEFVVDEIEKILMCGK